MPNIIALAPFFNPEIDVTFLLPHFGHLFAIGWPQCGQAAAISETIPPQAEHFTTPMIHPPCKNCVIVLADENMLSKICVLQVASSATFFHRVPVIILCVDQAE